MCIDITPESEQDYGEALVLCKDAVNCILGWRVLGLIDNYSTDPETASLSDEDVDRIAQPAKNVIDVFCSTASVLVREEAYFDLDYRSEFSKTHEFSFRDRTPEAFRLHFFRSPYYNSSQSADEISKMNHLSDFVADEQNEYLGYCVSRPHAPGTIGRSIVTTRAHSRELRDPHDLGRFVRTTVTENVQIFGISRSVVGVPFMEQDGHLLRCAHVSAWICHYSAVLRGLVARRATGEFHGSGDSREPYGRTYPSLGLSVSALSSILREMDLPPEVIDKRTLRLSRPAAWSDSPEVALKIGALAAAKAGADLSSDNPIVVADARSNIAKHRKYWLHLNLTATICRYLNSGIPCILTRRAQGHTQVVVGYLRSDVMSEGGASESGRPTHSDVVNLIVSDDRRGPYEIVSVETLVEEIDSNRSTTSLVVPLPRSLILPGADAERSAIALFSRVAQERLARLSDWYPAVNDAATLSRHREALTRFVEATSHTGNGTLSVRSYAILGSDLKESVNVRLTSPLMTPMVKALQLMQLPKYVWVSEAIDRENRSVDDEQPDVVAMIVADASDATTVYASARGDDHSQYGSPLFIQIPGQGRAQPRFADYVDSDEMEDARWFELGMDLFKSGRYSHKFIESVSPRRFAARFKTAGTRF